MRYLGAAALIGLASIVGLFGCRGEKSSEVLVGGLAVGSEVVVGGLVVGENFERVPHAKVIVRSVPDGALIAQTETGSRGGFAAHAKLPSGLISVTATTATEAFELISPAETFRHAHHLNRCTTLAANYARQHNFHIDEANKVVVASERLPEGDDLEGACSFPVDLTVQYRETSNALSSPPNGSFRATQLAGAFLSWGVGMGLNAALAPLGIAGSGAETDSLLEAISGQLDTMETQVKQVQSTLATINTNLLRIGKQLTNQIELASTKTDALLLANECKTLEASLSESTIQPVHQAVNDLELLLATQNSASDSTISSTEASINRTIIQTELNTFLSDVTGQIAVNGWTAGGTSGITGSASAINTALQDSTTGSYGLLNQCQLALAHKSPFITTELYLAAVQLYYHYASYQVAAQFLVEQANSAIQFATYVHDGTLDAGAPPPPYLNCAIPEDPCAPIDPNPVVTDPVVCAGPRANMCLVQTNLATQLTLIRPPVPTAAFVDTAQNTMFVPLANTTCNKSIPYLPASTFPGCLAWDQYHLYNSYLLPEQAFSTVAMKAAIPPDELSAVGLEATDFQVITRVCLRNQKSRRI